ncbi:Arginase/deacetylase [Hysterangium stoloniferum]|nr:Arginase/deacetylase [Hysterangium stoloniferum]
MNVVHSDDCLLHNPEYETLSGTRVPYLESPKRYAHIRKALSTPVNDDRGEFVKLFNFVEGDKTLSVGDHILSVHSRAYMTYVENAYDEWIQDGGDRDAVIPDTFLHHKLKHFKGDVDVSALRPIAKAGDFDLSTPITADTYKSAISAVRVALTASQILARESREAQETVTGRPLGVFALCRPPGHHAGVAICGGYCFFNNVAIAARFLQTEERFQPLSKATLKIAILDIDYHHGNGNYTGAEDEQGEGEGYGYNLNIPLPRVSTGDEEYYSALLNALKKITEYDPFYVIVSLGVDTYKDDPICEFNLTKNGYLRIGQAIATLKRPTLFVMEGGYHLPTIGANVREILQSFMKQPHVK